MLQGWPSTKRRLPIHGGWSLTSGIRRSTCLGLKTIIYWSWPICKACDELRMVWPTQVQREILAMLMLQAYAHLIDRDGHPPHCTRWALHIAASLSESLSLKSSSCLIIWHPEQLSTSHGPARHSPRWSPARWISTPPEQLPTDTFPLYSHAFCSAAIRMLRDFLLCRLGHDEPCHARMLCSAYSEPLRPPACVAYAHARLKPICLFVIAHTEGAVKDSPVAELRGWPRIWEASA